MSIYRRLSIAGFLLFGLILAVAPVQALPKDTPAFITGGLAWSPDGSQLAVGASDGVWIHDTHDLSVILRQTDQSYVSAMDWQSAGDLIASIGADRVIEIWNAKTGKTLNKLVDGKPGLGTSVRWSPDGSKLASANLDNTLRIWNMKSGPLLQTIQIANGEARPSVSWNPEGTQVVLHGIENRDSEGFSSKFGIWDAATGELVRSWMHNYLTDSTSWSADGHAIAAGSQSSNEAGSGGALVLFDPDLGVTITTLQTPYAGMINFLAWSPDSTRIASQMTSRSPTTSDEGQSDLQIWDTKEHKVIALLPNIYARGVGGYNNAVAWSRDGSKLASISDDGKVYIWDGNTYQQLAVYDGYKSMI